MDGHRKAKPPSEISIKRAVNGGFIVRHSFDNYGAGESYMPSQEHAFSDHASALRHVQKAMNGKPATSDQTAAPSKAAGVTAARTPGAGVD